MRITRSIAAGLIREHLWQPYPPGPTRDGRPWTMARELDIWDRLAFRYDRSELNGAITQLRNLTGATGPIRLTWLIRKDRGPALLARAIAAHHTALASAPSGPTRGGGLVRISVELPPPTIEVER